MSDAVRVGMWSGPRNISTAMMRAFENRPDTVVVDEPLYAAYLDRTGIDHPVREEVIASQPTDLATAVASLEQPLTPGRHVHYAKHMAHHVSRDMNLRWTLGFRNILLIRDPVEVVASYVRARETCDGEREYRQGERRPAPHGPEPRHQPSVCEPDGDQDDGSVDADARGAQVLVNLVAPCNGQQRGDARNEPRVGVKRTRTFDPWLRRVRACVSGPGV